MDYKIENVFVYVYNFCTGSTAVYPKVDIITDKYDVMPDELDYEPSIYHINSNGLLPMYLVFGSEGTVLKDTQTLTYTVWFKESNPREAMRLIYEQLRKEAKESILDIERRLSRERQRLLIYEKKLSELS